jgi:tetratricopeptide (TPR) repeat protein
MTTDALLVSVERTSRISALLMALGAIVVLGALWSATSKLNDVRSEVATLESTAKLLRDQRTTLDKEVSASRDDVVKLRVEISALRQALTASRDAIAAFHTKNYAEAVRLYDTALAADPGNSYLQNLRAYALFKLGHIDEAIKSQTEALQKDPSFVWGFFDLARFQCAAGNRVAASKSLIQAQDKEERFKELAVQDGEFHHLCGSLSRQ